MQLLNLFKVFILLLRETFSFLSWLFSVIFICFYILRLIKLHPFSSGFCSMKDSSILKGLPKCCMVLPINVTLMNLKLYKPSKNHHCKLHRDTIPYFYLEWIWYLQLIYFTECYVWRSIHFFMFMISQLF